MVVGHFRIVELATGSAVIAWAVENFADAASAWTTGSSTEATNAQAVRSSDEAANSWTVGSSSDATNASDQVVAVFATFDCVLVIIGMLEVMSNFTGFTDWTRDQLKEAGSVKPVVIVLITESTEASTFSGDFD